ncbi:MAG: response regulator [Gammaproteobacteria bacterium]
MLVDDSAVMVNEVSSFLNEHGIDTLIASNGQEGFDLVLKNIDIPLAIVDVNMPVLDGLSMIEKIRKEIPDCKTKFIMLTTEFDRKSKDKGRALGVKGWIIKPFKGDVAIGAIKKLLANA